MFHIDNEVLVIFTLLFELFILNYIVAYHEANILLLNLLLFYILGIFSKPKLFANFRRLYVMHSDDAKG